MSECLQDNPEFYTDQDTTMALVNVGTNDIGKVDTPIIAAAVQKIAINIKRRAPEAVIFVMHVPPLRANAEKRPVHEVHRKMLNQQLDEWALKTGEAHTVPLPLNIESGAPKNYLYDNDDVHFSNEANADIIRNTNLIITKVLLNSQ